MRNMRMSGSRREGGVQPRLRMRFGVEEVLTVALLTTLPTASVYVISEKLSLCNPTYNATLSRWHCLERCNLSSLGLSSLRLSSPGCPHLGLSFLSSRGTRPSSISIAIPSPMPPIFRTHTHIRTHSASIPHCLPHLLTKTNYHQAQWLPPTLPRAFARATSAHFPLTLRKPMSAMLVRAALPSSLGVATIGLAESQGTPFTSTTASLAPRLREPAHPVTAQTQVLLETPSSHLCSRRRHTAQDQAKLKTLHSANSPRPMARSFAPPDSIAFAGFPAAHASQTLKPVL